MLGSVERTLSKLLLWPKSDQITTTAKRICLCNPITDANASEGWLPVKSTKLKGPRVVSIIYQIIPYAPKGTASAQAEDKAVILRCRKVQIVMKLFYSSIKLHFVFRGGLSTYKELCSIASDLNQPDLIYKFMHLANHNALWNSRKVGSFMNYDIA